MLSKVHTTSLAVLIAAVPLAPASAERVFGLTADNRIVTFDSATPGVVTSSGAISGLASGDTLVGLDLRPANRTLYSLATSGNLYALSGGGNGYTATNLGAIGTAPGGTSFGFDFNPVVDRLRVVSDTNQNLRINPTVTPPVAIVDTPVTLNASPAVDLVAAAYRNSRPLAATTVLYGLDAASDALVRATNANMGTYTNTSVAGNVFAPLGFSLDVDDRVAFDISGRTNQGFFTINDAFYTVDQITGAGALVGGLGTGGITGIAVAGIPEPASWAMLITGFGLVGGVMRRRVGRAGAAAA